VDRPPARTATVGSGPGVRVNHHVGAEIARLESASQLPLEYRMAGEQRTRDGRARSSRQTLQFVGRSAHSSSRCPFSRSVSIGCLPEAGVLVGRQLISRQGAERLLTEDVLVASM